MHTATRAPGCLVRACWHPQLRLIHIYQADQAPLAQHRHRLRAWRCTFAADARRFLHPPSGMNTILLACEALRSFRITRVSFFRPFPPRDMLRLALALLAIAACASADSITDCTTAFTVNVIEWPDNSPTPCCCSLLDVLDQCIATVIQSKLPIAAHLALY